MSGKSDATEDQIPAHITLKSVLLVCFPESFPVTAFRFELFDFVFLRGLSCTTFLVFPLVFCSGRSHILLWVLSDTFTSSGKCLYILHCEISQTEEVDFLGLLTSTTKTPFVSSSCYLERPDLEQGSR